MQNRALWLPLTLLIILTGHVLADVDLVTIPRREGIRTKQLAGALQRPGCHEPRSSNRAVTNQYDAAPDGHHEHPRVVVWGLVQQH